MNLSNDIVVRIQETPVENTHAGKSLPNGDIIFGATRTPSSYISEMTLRIGSKSYELDTKYMYNAWGDRWLEMPDGGKYLAAHCYDENNCTIRGLFSDAGGAFVAEWRIIDGVPLRTIITDSSDVIGLFVEDISPPVFE